MATSGGAGSVPISIPVVTTGPTASVDRPDAPPEKVSQAEGYLQEQTQNEMLHQLQQNRSSRVASSFISRLRAELQTRYQLSERQITQTLKNYFEKGNGSLMPGHDAPEVQAALRGETPAVAAPQEGAGANAGGQQQQSGLARESRGAELARMERGQQTAATPSPTPALRTPTPPPQQVAASPTPPPPPPLPGAPMPRADGTSGMPQPLVADGTPQPEAVVVVQESPLPEGAPVVPTRTDGVPRNPTPEAPQVPTGDQGEVRYFVDSTNPRGTGASTETKEGFYTTVARAQFMFSGRVPQAPVPVPVRAPNDTFVARTREPSTTKTGERREGGEDRAGGSLDRSLALGMRRQFRDTAC